MTRDLTSGSPLKVIALFTLPLVLGNLFQQFTRWPTPSSSAGSWGSARWPRWGPPGR